MAVDAKRIQAVFLAALEISDPVQQAALLDRECGSDAQLRQRVEALLRTRNEPSEDPFEGTPNSTDGTLLIDSSTYQKKKAVATPGEEEEDEKVSLEFLQPSTKPESLGRLGHYEVLEVLGRGGFGIVVRAFDEKLQRVVAIKVLLPQVASTSPARKRFLREARAAARIRHDNVVQIYAVEEQPLPYLVMEYIPGRTLQEHLDQTGPLEVADVLRIGEQIARGLAAAHEHGLIHRDIKPGNVLLESGPESKVKITDFGLARAADDASITKSGTISGTPLFMAPEQANGEPLDHRADLFSLGSVLYTLVSGRPPFRAATTMAVLKRVASDPPRPIREIIAEVPQGMCDLIARLHAKDPAQRFQSAKEVADLLGRHRAHPDLPLPVAMPKTGVAPRQSKLLRVAVLAAAAVVLVALGAVLAYPLWYPSGPPAVTSEPSTSGASAATPTELLQSHVLQGRPAVRDALIDFAEPEISFGTRHRDNSLRRAEHQCNAFLVRFDLAKLGVPPKARVEKATLSFFVWDPSSNGKTKVCAFPLKTAWDEEAATWVKPSAGQSWRDGKAFEFGADTGPPGPAVIVQPDRGGDTVDPPIEYQLDVTALVRSWLDGGAPNYGLAIAPEIDPTVDEGVLTRFQMYGSEHSRTEFTPKLTVQVWR